MLLTHGPLRHAALRRLINLMRHPAEPEITQRILTLRLRDLEFNGLIARTIFEEKVVRVEYSLTDLGRDMMKYVAELNYFLLANADRIAQARAAFSQKQGHELP